MESSSSLITKCPRCGKWRYPSRRQHIRRGIRASGSQTQLDSSGRKILNSSGQRILAGPGDACNCACATPPPVDCAQCNSGTTQLKYTATISGTTLCYGSYSGGPFNPGVLVFSSGSSDGTFCVSQVAGSPCLYVYKESPGVTAAGTWTPSGGSTVNLDFVIQLSRFGTTQWVINATLGSPTGFTPIAPQIKIASAISSADSGDCSSATSGFTQLSFSCGGSGLSGYTEGYGGSYAISPGC